MVHRRWTALATLILAGCATAQPRQQLTTAPSEVAEVFRGLTQAAGGDGANVIVSEAPSPVVNAAAAGGSRFIVTSGLVATNNRCLLLGIAAHELGHDALGHVRAARSARTGVSLASNVVGAVIPFGGLIVQLAAAPALQAYSRNQETEADREAVAILQRAGEPSWMLRYAFDFLIRLHGEGGGGWLSSHPARQDRLSEQPAFDDRVTDLCGPEIELDRQVAIARTRIFLARERRAIANGPDDESARD